MIGVRRTAAGQGIVCRAIGHCGHASDCTNRDAGAERVIAPAIPIAIPITAVDINIIVDIGVAVSRVDPVAAVVDAAALTRTLTRPSGATGTANAARASRTADTANSTSTADTANSTRATDAARTSGTSDATDAACTADATGASRATCATDAAAAGTAGPG
jgi:hypothetical protein